MYTSILLNWFFFLPFTLSLLVEVDYPKNPFPQFSIGNPSIARINVTNDKTWPVTIYQVSGALSHNNVIVQNLTITRLRLTIKPNKTASIRYKFTPELDLPRATLFIYLDYYDKEETDARFLAVDKVIQLVYNDSIFDLQNASIYLLGILGCIGILYYIYQTFTTSATPMKPIRVMKKEVIESVGSQSDEPDLSWIPDHVLPKQKTSPKLKKEKVRTCENEMKDFLNSFIFWIK